MLTAAKPSHHPIARRQPRRGNRVKRHLPDSRTRPGGLAAASPDRVKASGFQNYDSALVTVVGLWYFRQRYYLESLGRFVHRDPLRYVDGYNLYRSYMVPNHLDPTGMAEDDGTANPPGPDGSGDDGFTPAPPSTNTDNITDDGGFINNDAGDPVGVVSPGDMNCLGYACGLDAAVDISAYEGESGSMEALLNELGYECTPMENRSDCKDHCECDDWMFLYIYIPSASPHDLDDYEGQDPFSDPIFDPESPGDVGFHAQRGEENGYSQVSGYYSDVGDDPYGNARMAGSYSFDEMLGSYCCCKSESTE